MYQLVSRPDYLKKLIRLKDKDIIKVITGIRRCGKSTLFTLFINYLKSHGVSDEQIIRVNLENPKYYELRNYLQLYRIIKEQLSLDRNNYIFIDEVQMVPEFQKA